MELTEGIKSPEIFRRWSAIACLAGVMERKVWLRWNQKTLYPNLYILLVGPPGVGKGMAMDDAEELWRSITDLHVAPSSVSKASLMDTLNDAKRQILRPGEEPNYVAFNSLLIAARELGQLLPEYDRQMMSALQDLWDLKVYEERKRGGDLQIKIEKPFLHLLGAATPNYMQMTFPEGAWEQGFASRTIIVFSGENIFVNPFNDNRERNEELFDALRADLHTVATQLYGKMEWTEDAARTFLAWMEAGGEPKPTHPKLQGYLTRREVNIAKVCMVFAISRGSFVIDVEDYKAGCDLVLQAEYYMPDLFRSMKTGGDSEAMDETFLHVHAIYAKTKKPIPQSEIVDFLKDRVPSHSVMRVLDIMLASRMIEPDGLDARNMPLYKPVSRALR